MNCKNKERANGGGAFQFCVMCENVTRGITRGFWSCTLCRSSPCVSAALACWVNAGGADFAADCGAFAGLAPVSRSWTRIAPARKIRQRTASWLVRPRIEANSYFGGLLCVLSEHVQCDAHCLSTLGVFQAGRCVWPRTIGAANAGCRTLRNEGRHDGVCAAKGRKACVANGQKGRAGTSQGGRWGMVVVCCGHA